MQPFNNNLNEAKKHVRDNKHDGVNCPCCGQFVKVYPRRFNSGMSYALIMLYKLHLQQEAFDYINVPKEFTKLGVNPSNTEYSKLTYWFLIEREPNDDEAKHKSGNFKITKDGIDFVLGRKAIRKRVYMFNGEIQGYSEDKVTIQEVAYDKFNYTELMGGDERKPMPKQQISMF